MDWWENATLTLERTAKSAEAGVSDDTEGPEHITAQIICLPSQHSSSRGLFDKDHTLWASWAVKSGDKSVWFAGDTGYRAVPELAEGVDDYGPEFEDLPWCPYFKQIGELYGPFDLGLIPIGAYSLVTCSAPGTQAHVTLWRYSGIPDAEQP
jgi:N-acyl-phosphatidylethanolamine-hydrolysing phospholipase D